MPRESPAAPARTARRSRDPQELFRLAKAGDRGALGRLLSLIEQGGEPARIVGRLTFPASAALEHVVGITGAPGSGKSTLTDRLIAVARGEDRQVGVLAVDPSSPYSGGALLGDRVRMQGHALDEGVFVRSMASRGHLGGLALAAPAAIRALGSAGLALVLVETVGVGQVEVEIAGAADTTVVVVNPGWGDAIQASKAGLLEVADVFVVNKADRPGAAEARRDLENMLDLAIEHAAWRPPVLLATASTGEGTDGVWAAVSSHRAHLVASGELERRRQRRLRDEFAEVLVRRLEERVRRLAGGDAFEAAAADVAQLRVDPYDAADQLLDGLE
ncbi:MAG: methylmalonyl Co-A mutase-associated GTPase MeaB [Acidimicrobiaceae bacterium]|nr:methylmalonyl Co-A mutase-associated GTPase MeaB [Acidimicrobiaceae bacterium]